MPVNEAAQALSQFALEIIARVHFKAQLNAPSKDQLQQIAGAALMFPLWVAD